MRLYEIREPRGIDALTMTERPTPAPGPRQALVRVHAVSINYRDLLVAKGHYSRHLTLPLIPCSDGAGEVVEVGAAVTRVKPGDRVAGIFMQRWLSENLTEEKSRSALGGAIDGVLAEYRALDEDGLVHLPAHLSYEQAATLPCAAVTAWHALFSEGGLKTGDTLLTLGTGGVSLFAVQFAKLAGARVIATSSSDAKLQRLREMGVSDGINYQSEPDWDARVRELTGGAGVDHVVEVGGAGTLPRSIRAVRMGGQISLIGVLTGAGQIDPLPLLMKNVRLQGIYVGSRAMFEAMNRVIAVHELCPIVDHVFPFEDAPAALRMMEGGGHFGKIVIHGPAH